MYDSNYMTFWKRQNLKDWNYQCSLRAGCGERWLSWAQRIVRPVKIHCVTQSQMNVIIHLFKPKECATPRVSPNANSGLRVTVSCRCRFINCNKRQPLSWKKSTHVEGWGADENFLYLPFNFSVNLNLLKKLS